MTRSQLYVSRLYYIDSANRIAAIDSRPMAFRTARRIASLAKRSDYELLDGEYLSVKRARNSSPKHQAVRVKRLDERAVKE